MQSKSLFFLFLLVFAIPVFVLSLNHELFFAIASLIILVVSIKNIYMEISGQIREDNASESETAEELEEMIDIDVERFGVGINVIKNLLTILFLTYSAFFMDAFALKLICSLAILMQIHFIIKKLNSRITSFKPNQYRLKYLLASVLNIAVIVFALLNKLSRLR